METTITPINGKEIIARIVLAPKDIDVVTGYPKDNFITPCGDKCLKIC